MDVFITKSAFLQVHYGFVLKTSDNDLSEGAKYLSLGIASGAEGTADSRFYYHLGDALQRLNRTPEAFAFYDDAVGKGLFLSRYQRSTYNVDRLKSRPLWTLDQTTYGAFFRRLEASWEVIKEEGLAALALPLKDGFRPEAEGLQDTGDWKQFELFSRGRKLTANCVKTPKTCELVTAFEPAAKCKRGQVGNGQGAACNTCVLSNDTVMIFFDN